MLNSVVFLALLPLAPAAADDLTISGMHLTYGVLGPPRTKAQLLPGDNLIVGFDIVGITTDPDGKVHYRMTTEVANGTGKVLHRQPARDLEAVNSLGGGRLPAFAQVDIGLDSPPGDYTLKVNVTDLATKKNASATQKFTVLPRAFGVV